MLREPEVPRWISTEASVGGQLCTGRHYLIQRWKIASDLFIGALLREIVDLNRSSSLYIYVCERYFTLAFRHFQSGFCQILWSTNVDHQHHHKRLACCRSMKYTHECNKKTNVFGLFLLLLLLLGRIYMSINPVWRNTECMMFNKVDSCRCYHYCVYS